MNRYRPRGLLEPDAWKAGTSGSEGAPAQQCAGATRRWRTQRRPRPSRTGKTAIYTYPSKKSLASVMDKVRTLTRRAQHRTLADLLRRLNPVLGGWCNYFRHGVSKRTFSYLDSFVFKRILGWLRKRHDGLNLGTLVRRHLPDWEIRDGEIELFRPHTEGSMGNQVTMKGVTSETAKFQRSPNTKVFTDDNREVEPGSDEVGMVASGGNVPLGYFKDEEKSARTFRVVNGRRYAFAGGFAKVAADGTLILLGRGNQVINTGGEKVFPEEVEEAVKRVPGVRDCLVVGIDDDKFGQAVTAVASLEDGAEVDAATIIRSVKGDLAGYKAPKSVVFVEQIWRAPNGKAEYRTARDLAAAKGA